MKKSKKAIRKAVEKIVNDRKTRAIKPDQDPLGWAKSICDQKSLTDDQSESMDEIKNAAVILISSIIQCCKPSSDRTTAIRKVREAMMFAKEAVVIDWEDPA